jgi:hypothetical protein
VISNLHCLHNLRVFGGVLTIFSSVFVCADGSLWHSFSPVQCHCCVYITGITNGSPWRTTAGGAEGLVSRDEMWAVAHRSRLAELLRVRIGEFRASTFSDLVAKLERLPWSAYIKRGIATMPIVSAIAYKSRLIHTG